MSTLLSNSEMVSNENHLQVRRFAGALRVAVYDRLIEQEQEIEFYFDADVLLDVVSGLSQVQPGRVPRTKLVMRALLSSGYLGRLSVLRPHALEFDRKLRNLPSFAVRGQQQLFKATISDTMREWKLDQYDDEIGKIAAAVVPETTRAESLLNFLHRAGYETFVGMELAAGGTWKARLARLWKTGHLRFKQQEIDLEAMLTHDQTQVFMDVLAGHRPGADWSINNLTDVLALRSLAEAVRRRRGKQVRFYTDTEVLQRVIREEGAVQTGLSYGAAAPESTILRDDDYFLIRASLAALAFPGVHADVRGDEVGLDELLSVSNELNAVLSAHGENIDHYIRSAEIGGRRLAEVIADFETLNFVDRVWLTYRPPEPMQKFLPGIVALYSDPLLLAATTGEIDAAVVNLRKEVGDYVQDLRGWARSFERIRNAAGEAQRIRAATTDPLPDPWRDLGLGRWGIDVEVRDPEAIADQIHDFLRSSGTDLDLRCASLAFRIASKEEEIQELESSCILLWFLELYELLHREFQQGAGRLKPEENSGLFILDSVAQMRITQRGDRRAKQRIMDNLRRLLSGLPDRKRGYGLLGLAYVCYWAWRDEMDETGLYRTEIGPATPRMVDAWAKESFAHGNRAVKILKTGTLAWAFAVNHCAYMGSVANLGVDRTVRHVQRLGSIRNRADLWHYRFEDTVAVHFTFQVIYALRERGLKFFNRDGGDAERKRLCTLLADAKSYLNRAKPFFEDPEVQEHRQHVSTLLAMLRC